MSLSANEENELLTLLQLEQVDKARRNLIDFLLLDGNGNWERAKHLELLCSKLEAVERGEIKRLMVFMPPRHGKSEVVSKKFPAWYLGRNPGKEMIISSYSGDLANDFSRIAKSTLNEWGEKLWGTQLSRESRAVDRWGIEGHRGGLTAAGVGGPITGRGAKVAIIDDPFKNYEEAASDTIRQKVWDWYRSTLRTRLAPGGSIVLVMTRWHEDDLAGRLLNEAKIGGEQWEVISLAAEAEENDPLKRKLGNALWPSWFPIEELKALAKSLGSYLYSALYQQRPSPAEGLKFKRSWFRYFEQDDQYYKLLQPDGTRKLVEKSKCWRFQTTDTAATEKESSDYFVCSTWDVTPQCDLLLVDVFREKAETTKHEAIISAQYNRYKPQYIRVENKTYGLNIIQNCVKLGLPVIAAKADTDKVSRSLVIQARYEVGTVYHRLGMNNLGDIEDELTSFPTGKHDDFVDTASIAGNEIAGQIPESEPVPEPEYHPRRLRQEEPEIEYNAYDIRDDLGF